MKSMATKHTAWQRIKRRLAKWNDSRKRPKKQKPIVIKPNEYCKGYVRFDRDLTIKEITLSDMRAMRKDGRD